MDLVTNRAMEVTQLALNGLSSRHKVLSSNVANAMTSGYQRADVEFEGQLQQIIKVDDVKQALIASNSGVKYSPNSIEALNLTNIKSNTASSTMILNNNPYTGFKPTVITDNSPAVTLNGNNVNIESEMTELMKNGTKYSVLAEIEGKMFKGIQEVIKGAI